MIFRQKESFVLSGKMNKEITELASDLQKINYNNAHPRSLIKSSQGTLWVAKDLMRFQGDIECFDQTARMHRLI